MIAQGRRPGASGRALERAGEPDGQHREAAAPSSPRPSRGTPCRGLAARPPGDDQRRRRGPTSSRRRRPARNTSSRRGRGSPAARCRRAAPGAAGSRRTRSCSGTRSRPTAAWMSAPASDEQRDSTRAPRVHTDDDRPPADPVRQAAGDERPGDGRHQQHGVHRARRRGVHADDLVEIERHEHVEHAQAARAAASTDGRNSQRRSRSRGHLPVDPGPSVGRAASAVGCSHGRTVGRTAPTTCAATPSHGDGRPPAESGDAPMAIAPKTRVPMLPPAMCARWPCPIGRGVLLGEERVADRVLGRAADP